MRSARQEFRHRLLGLAVAACFAGTAHANPTGPSVAGGAASFASSGNTLTITNTPGTIINWRAFSIRPDEVTRFVQSGAASAVLNRVTGAGQSALLGQLLSNGRVFLINPNGVTIGAGARIDTAGFVASSLNLSNEDFLAGKFRFTDPGNAGKVANAGTITAHSGGPVYLIAPTVENHGVITAPNGDILLAAGKTVELVSAANPDMRVQVQAGGETLNVGRLVAESGRVGLYGAAIRNAGTISADSAGVNAAGNVVLRASKDVTLEPTTVLTANGASGGAVSVQAEAGTLLAEGRIEAKGSQGGGGEVKLLGERVGLMNRAAVDASGAAGGGTVLVGGDFRGSNPDVQNARVTYVAPDAKLVADAADSGDGGKVIVWADGTTRFGGSISARGGAAAGNGGFAEVSGKETLEYSGSADLRAGAGAAGTLLLDPKFILIQAGGAAPVATNDQFTENPTGTSVISGANLATAINTASVTLQANTDITIDDNVTAATANRNLTLQAGRSIVFNAGRAVTLNDSQFTATVNDAAAQAANRDPGAAQFLMNAGSAIVTQGKTAGARGNVAINVGAFGGSSAGAQVTLLGGATIDTTGAANRAAGAVTLNAAGGTVDTSAGTITANGGVNSAAGVGRAGGATAITGASVTTGAISTRGSDGVGGNNAGGTGGAVTLTAGAVGGALQLDGALDTRGGNSVGTGNTGAGGAVTLRTANNGTIASAGAGTITTTGGRGQTGGAFTVTSVTPATDTVASVSLAGAINVDGGVTAASGTLAGKNAGAVSITNVNAVTLGGISARGSNAGGGDNVGGNGGAVNIDARGTTPSIALAGAIDTRGGDATGTGNAGNGGSVRLRTAAGGSVTGAGAATITTTGGRGQTGGNVTVTGIAAADTLATVNLPGAITANGGVAAASGTLGGKNAGTVAIGNATSITLGAISARASNAGGGNTVGGNGGPVTINRLGAASAVALNGTIDTRGGDSAGTGDTGNGGAVTIDGGTAPNLGTLTLAAGANIDTRGGRGQTGGAVTIRDFTSIAMADSSVDTSGGAAATNSAATGAGKSAGAIAVTGTGAVSTATLTARGSNATAGSGKAGGAGAAVTLTGGGVALNGSIATMGGSGDGAGAAGAGGAVGINGGAAAGVTQVAASTVNAGSATITVDANDGAIDLAGMLTTTNSSATAVVIRDATTAALGTVSAASGTVVLGQAGVNNLSGAVAQNAGTSITAATLSAVGGNAVTLENANQVGTLAATTATGGFTLNNGNNPLTVSGNVTTTNSAVAIGTGTGTYTQNTNIDVSAGSGGITLTADQVVLGTNTGNNALTTSGTLTLKPASPGRPMRIGSTAGADTPGTFELRAAEIGAFATGATGPIVIGDAAASTGTLTVAGAVALGGKQVTLNAGNMTDAGTQTITAQSLALNARTGTIGAGANPIDVAVTNLSLTTQDQNAFVASAGGYNLGAAGSSVGTATLGLGAGGAVTQSAGVPITAGSLVLSGAGGNFALTQNNSVDTLAANTGAVNFVDGKALTVGTVNGVAGVTGTGNVSIRTVNGAGNDITLANNVAATGAGANVTVASGEDVHYGTATLTAGAGGRWLTYSRDPATDTGTIPGPGNAKPNVYDSSFGALGPGVVLPATGNHHVYSYQPQLVYTATPASRAYGEPNPAFTGTVAGLVNGDTAADAYTGTLSFASPALPNSNVGSYAIDGAGLSSDIGYGFVQALTNATALTVGQRPITITATPGQTKVYGSADPAFAYGVAGGPGTTGPAIVAGDSLAGALGRTAGENVGAYPINPGTLAPSAPGNYAVSFVPNGFGITPATLTVAADPQTKVYGAPDPTLTYNAVGFRFTDTPATVLSGGLARIAGETVAGGPYAINQGTLAPNANYTISYTGNNLAITPAALTIAANNATRPYGDPNPAFAATFTGLANGDAPAAIPGVALTTPAVLASNAGDYPISVASGANANYSITYVNGQLAIAPAPLTIAANDAARPFGLPNPPFTATSTGFKLGQTAGSLNGTLSLTTPAAATSPAGPYPITPSGVSSPNYAITFVNGTLLVGQAPPPNDQPLVAATGRSQTGVSVAGTPGATTAVEQCQLRASAGGGALGAAQASLNAGTSSGRATGAPFCEPPPQR